MLKKVAKRVSGITKSTAETLLVELVTLHEKRKTIEKREGEIKDQLIKYLEKNISPDSKGHYTFEVLDPFGIPLIFQRQARKKISINQEKAISFFRENNLHSCFTEKEVIAKEVTQDQIVEVLLKHGYTNFIDREEVVDEIAVEKHILDGKLSMEDFENLCDTKITYANVVIKGEDKKCR